MTNNTINVPRELLENIVLCYNDGEFELGTLAAECHALLSAPSPAGVDGLPEFLTQELEAVGQEAVAKAVDDQCSSVPVLQAVYGEAIRKRVVDDAQAIIDGLRGEVDQLQSMLATVSKAGIRVRTDRDQQAQRIGELEGLLRAESARVDFLDAYIVTADAPDTGKAAMLADSGTLRECIDAALSAGKVE